MCCNVTLFTSTLYTTYVLDPNFISYVLYCDPIYLNSVHYVLDPNFISYVLYMRWDFFRLRTINQR